MMKIHEYFLAEKNESLAFIIIGTAAIICSFYFWLAINQRFFNGLAWPLLFVAFIQLSVGSYIYYRTPQDLDRVMTFASTNPKNLKNVEIPRMEKVVQKFKLYKYIELGLIVLGLIVFFIGSAGSFWKGFGMGMVFQGGLMLLADYIASTRGQVYLDFLKNFVP